MSVCAPRLDLGLIYEPNRRLLGLDGRLWRFYGDIAVSWGILWRVEADG